MENANRVVRLLKNHLYPTYQLHAYMDSKKTTPQAGLRLAGLIVMDWLRQRLGENTPEELLRWPEPSSYLDCDNSCLPSLYINHGFVINIVSLPEQGMWSIQITEPHLGSDPGKPEQRRSAVPGRVIETNIGFRIDGPRLECGFQTIISDPEGTVEPAEVYRLAVIRRLAQHPDFGLRQVTRITGELGKIETVTQLRSLESLWRDDDNQLPCVIFTNSKPDPAILASTPKFQPSAVKTLLPIPSPAVKETQEQEVDRPAQVLIDFASSCMSFCRSFWLCGDLTERAAGLFAEIKAPGDILVLEPRRFGGKACSVACPSKTREETLHRLQTQMHNYPRGKDVSFGRISFLSATREEMLVQTKIAMERSKTTSQEWAQKVETLDVRWQVEMREKEIAYQTLFQQLERQKQYQQRLEQEKAQLSKEYQQAIEKWRTTVMERDEEIAYLKRKLSQPTEHLQIADWVANNFQGRLLLHPKAVARLEEPDARNVDIGLICDALDFLATDYWDNRFARISKEEMNSRCSQKYGRPFEIKPTGTTTIEFTPTQYKIKYFQGAMGKLIGSPLDYHLGVGNSPENLLRIYFLHDDEKKLIVVGSLPRHLRAVTIK